MNIHWTARSIEDFLFRIAMDFIVQLEDKMESLSLSQNDLAKKLGVTKGNISQMFNNPGNLGLNKIIKYSKALNMKVAIVAYDDDDPENKKGPINSEIFKICWEKSDKPREFWAFQETKKNMKAQYTTLPMTLAANPAIRVADVISKREQEPSQGVPIVSAVNWT